MGAEVEFLTFNLQATQFHLFEYSGSFNLDELRLVIEADFKTLTGNCQYHHANSEQFPYKNLRSFFWLSSSIKRGSRIRP